jgi:hypothetical protein
MGADWKLDQFRTLGLLGESSALGHFHTSARVPDRRPPRKRASSGRLLRSEAEVNHSAGRSFGAQILKDGSPSWLRAPK